jgi:hypothetical protein
MVFGEKHLVSTNYSPFASVTSTRERKKERKLTTRKLSLFCRWVHWVPTTPCWVDYIQRQVIHTITRHNHDYCPNQYPQFAIFLTDDKKQTKTTSKDVSPESETVAPSRKSSRQRVPAGKELTGDATMLEGMESQ